MVAAWLRSPFHSAVHPSTKEEFGLFRGVVIVMPTSLASGCDNGVSEFSEDLAVWPTPCSLGAERNSRTSINVPGQYTASSRYTLVNTNRSSSEPAGVNIRNR